MAVWAGKLVDLESSYAIHWRSVAVVSWPAKRKALTWATVFQIRAESTVRPSEARAEIEREALQSLVFWWSWLEMMLYMRQSKTVS